MERCGEWDVMSMSRRRRNEWSEEGMHSAVTTLTDSARAHAIHMYSSSDMQPYSALEWGKPMSISERVQSLYYRLYYRVSTASQHCLHLVGHDLEQRSFQCHSVLSIADSFESISVLSVHCSVFTIHWCSTALRTHWHRTDSQCTPINGTLDRSRPMNLNYCHIVCQLKRKFRKV